MMMNNRSGNEGWAMKDTPAPARHHSGGKGKVKGKGLQLFVITFANLNKPNPSS